MCCPTDYQELLNFLKKNLCHFTTDWTKAHFNCPDLLLCHDIDFSLEQALKLAHLEMRNDKMVSPFSKFQRNY